MKAWLASLPIRGKLMLLASLASATALIIAASIISVMDYRAGRHALLHRLQTQADVVAMGAAAAVAFDDEAAAARALDALAADRAVVEAEVFRADGRSLSRRQFDIGDRKSTHRWFFTPPSDPIQIESAIVLGQRIGSLRLTARTDEINADLARDGYVLSAALVAALAVSLLAALLLQGIISVRVRSLAEMANTVSKVRDYSLRLEPQGRDEIGQLIVAFNCMLEQIERQTQQLHGYQTELEQKVATRTEQLKLALDDARAATRAKSDFLANMSHEIRTPMNGMIGMLELLQDAGLESEYRMMLDTARNSADALLTLINDVLDFSKIEAGRLTLEQIDLELRPLVEETSTLFARGAHLKGVNVACLVDEEVPVAIRGDPTRLRQILSNLIGNAVKFTERGEVFVGISVRGSGESARLLLAVRDTGIGMSEDSLKRVFESFTQGDNSMTRRYGGTGLGLAITRQLVTAMSGTIEVASQFGVGSTFTVSLPAFVSTTVSSSPPVDLAGVRGLIFDADATNRRVLQEYLSAAGASIVSARSLHEAELAARGQRLDFVAGNAPALLALRALPGLASLKYVLVAAPGGKPAQSEAGGEIYIYRPVRRADLLGATASLMGRGDVLEAATVNRILRVQTYEGARVLLVEDNPVNQEVARRILQTYGIKPAVCVNGAEAVARLDAEAFDLVLMDCQMPVMDGYQATEAIRTQEAARGRARIPILAMTANAMAGDRERCLAAGMDDYLTKPFKREALGALLGRWLIGAPPRAPPSSAVVAPTSVERTLDEEVLGQLRDIFDGDVSGVVHAYLIDGQNQISSMASALERQNCVELGRAAHSLKSTSRSVGAEAVANVAEELEVLARHEGCAPRAVPLLQTLRERFIVAESALAEVVTAVKAQKPAA